MTIKTNSGRGNTEDGHVLFSVLVLMAIGLIITTGMMGWASNSLSTKKVVESNAKNFYAVERSINAVTAWLQDNSKNMVLAFSASNFSNNFTLGDPTVGDNEGSAFAVPTLIKMKNTNNAVQLSNHSFFGTSAFPVTTNIDTSTSFDAVSAFSSADFGSGVSVRILMVWALETDGNYQPIFRVDAVTGGGNPEHGVHGLNFIKSALVTSEVGVGYYADTSGFTTGTPNNECWSYQYTWNAGTSSWSRGAPRSNCFISANSPITLKSAIHGSVATNTEAGITLNGGSISGSSCATPGCVSYSLPVLPDWTTKCSGGNMGDVTAANPTNLPTGTTLATQCYRDITIGSNKRINITTPNEPYYIRNMNFQNNSNSKMTFDTIGPGNKYILYLDSIAGNRINGNQFVATNLAPNQLEVYITKDGSLEFNGTASVHGIFTGRSGNVTFKLNGNFTHYGAIRGLKVETIGNTRLGYDEGVVGTATLSDLNYTLYKASQRYR